MKNQQSGFTLIELIAVIVILGILAATAIPKFIDLSDAAAQAAVKGVAGSLGAAMALNHAVDIASDAGVESAPTPEVVDNCDDGGTLLDGGLPTGYTITGGVIASGASATCTVTHDDTSKFATFRGYGT